MLVVEAEERLLQRDAKVRDHTRAREAKTTVKAGFGHRGDQKRQEKGYGGRFSENT